MGADVDLTARCPARLVSPHATSDAPDVLPGEEIERIVELARHRLKMELCYIVEFTADGLMFRWMDGDQAAFGVQPGLTVALSDADRRRLPTKRLSRAGAREPSDDPLLLELCKLSKAYIGGYVSVPLVYSGGMRFGTLCCVSEGPRSLDSSDMAFLGILADLLMHHLDHHRRHDALSRQIAHVIAGAELPIVLQPIVDLQNWTCRGAEALSRFPALMGAPDEVFREARASGVDVALESLAARSALTLAPRMRPDQYLSINMSPSVVRQAAAAVFGPEDRSLEQVVLEITENDSVEDYPKLAAALEPLRERGLRVAIDDAGAGYSSLRHVVELRPDIIKIDRLLVHGMAHDAAKRSIGRSFVQLAADTGAFVIAEGIDNRDDLSTARDIGVTAGQGFLLGEPTADPDRIGLYELWSLDRFPLVGEGAES
jgi:EAL domain-containing protein (putative c-di-GMP-specific phosphodiesterase class I)